MEPEKISKQEGTQCAATARLQVQAGPQGVRFSDTDTCRARIGKPEVDFIRKPLRDTGVLLSLLGTARACPTVGGGQLRRDGPLDASHLAGQVPVGSLPSVICYRAGALVRRAQHPGLCEIHQCLTTSVA